LIKVVAGSRIAASANRPPKRKESKRHHVFDYLEIGAVDGLVQFAAAADRTLSDRRHAGSRRSGVAPAVLARRFADNIQVIADCCGKASSRDDCLCLTSAAVCETL